VSKSDRFKRLAENRDADSSNPQKPHVIEKIVGDFELQSGQATTTTVHEQPATSVISTSDTAQLSGKLNNKNEHEQSNVTEIRNSSTEQSNVTEKTRSSNSTRIPRPIEEFEKRLKKPTIEETHTRGTWLIRNDLLKRLDKLAKHQQRGFKTYVVNYALESVLDELEKR